MAGMRCQSKTMTKRGSFVIRCEKQVGHDLEHMAKTDDGSVHWRDIGGLDPGALAVDPDDEPRICGARNQEVWPIITAVCELSVGHPGKHRCVIDPEKNRVASWNRQQITPRERTKP